MNEEEFRTKYKKAVDTMMLDEKIKEQLENKLAWHAQARPAEQAGSLRESLAKRQERKRPRRTLYIAAGIVLAAGIGLAAPSFWQQSSAPETADVMLTETSSNTVANTADSVVIPVMELPDMSSGAMMNMVTLVVYKGQVYTQSSTLINAASAEALRGGKLGRTTGGIDEWSGQDKYIELASNIGETDIFAVKGYDSDFRIMSYRVIDGEGYAELYERTNGISIHSGADLLGKLKLEGRVSAAEWESFESWNNGLSKLAPLAGNDLLGGFIAALQDAQPLAAEPLFEQGIYDGTNRKIIYLTLEDNTRVELTLFGEGLVRYGHAPVFFKPASAAFQALWDSMQAASK